MWFMDWIIDLIFDIAKLFYWLYYETRDWVSPFRYISDFFYDLYEVFWELLDPFQRLNVWIENTADAIEDILSWSNIRSLIRSWLPGIESLITWWTDWWNKVTGVINSWWLTVQVTVKGWIDIAVQGLEDLIEAWDYFWEVTWPKLTRKLDDLKAAWDNFWITIFPTLLTFTWLTTWWNSRLVEVNKLINDTIRVWFPFYNELVSLWGEIKAFFADPLQWCYNKLDEWFERFW